MRISTDQPFPSTATADAHTPSHDGSSLVSLKSTPSYLLPRRTDAELEAGEVIVLGVEVDHHPVGVGRGVAARQAARDLVRVVVEQPDADVDRMVVIEDAHLGRLGGRLDLRRGRAG